MKRFAWLCALALAGCGSAAGPDAVPGARVPRGCDLVAAPGGSDAAPGTPRRPLRTPQALADALHAGQTGCLRRGTYRGRGADGYVLRFAHGGRRGARLTVRSFPGERARLAGVVYVPRGSDDVTLASVDVDDPTPFLPARQIAVQVNAARTLLADLDVTTHARKTCLILGDTGRFGPAVATVVRDSVLHRCGDPGNELRDHAIYVASTRGATIEGNLIWGAGGYAVHLYPDARRVRVAGNVLADNGGGVIFAGDGTYASAGNAVEHNVISGSLLTENLSSYWPDGAGSGNAARDNCLAAGPGGDVAPELGVEVSGNVESDPNFADAAAHDYRLLHDTACTPVIGTRIAERALSR